jgi:thiosulfate/3-mercaptopyruvate sulfurtransferase
VIDPIISPSDLARLREPVALADVRWYLDGRSGRAAFEAGHLPGARFVDLDADLSDHSRPATEGRHPLPSPEAFAAAMSRLGIGDETTVVAYDDSGGGTAGRLVFMLRVIGHDAALLDGGLVPAAAVLGPETGPPPTVEPARFTPRAWPTDRFVDAGLAAAHAAAGGALLDARSAERYRGEQEVVDPRPGHIPGAVSAPWQGNLGDDGRFRSAAALKARFDGLGAGDDVVCYCGSGVSACANLLALERAGIRSTRLYVGSWSGWSADPARSVATGPA